jgi:hypothetical protein
MSTTENVSLLSAASSTGDAVWWPGGSALWMVHGTWGNAVAQLQVTPDDGTTWIDLGGMRETANGGWTEVPLPAVKVRVAISNAGATTSLSSSLKPL